MFQEVFKFSTLSGLFPKDVQEVQEFLEVTRARGENSEGLLLERPFALAVVGWLCFRAKESRHRHKPHLNHELGGNPRLPGVAHLSWWALPVPQPWPSSLSSWYCSSWRDLGSCVSISTFTPRKSPRLEHVLTAYISSLVLETEQIL